MPKYRVHGSVPVCVSIEVEADNEDDAIEKAGEEWPGLTGYAGNGSGGDRLIGPSDFDGDPQIEEDGSEPDFTSANPV